LPNIVVPLFYEEINKTITLIFYLVKSSSVILW
jgi:hypothetical protein